MDSPEVVGDDAVVVFVDDGFGGFLDVGCGYGIELDVLDVASGEEEKREEVEEFFHIYYFFSLWRIAVCLLVDF